jgi:hypothetical protein
MERPEQSSVELMQDLHILLPLAQEWANRQGADFRRTGSPLDPSAWPVACRLGVTRPEAVRVARVASIAGPEHPRLRRACQSLGFLGPATAGLTLGYGLALRADLADNRPLLAHELRHVAQYERYASLDAYLEDYIRQLLAHGYEHCPFELDARQAELAWP